MAKKKGATVIEWLRQNQVFSFTALERKADIPSGYLSKQISGIKICREQHLERLAVVLAAYGFK